MDMSQSDAIKALRKQAKIQWKQDEDKYAQEDGEGYEEKDSYHEETINDNDETHPVTVYTNNDNKVTHELLNDGDVMLDGINNQIKINGSTYCGFDLTQDPNQSYATKGYLIPHSQKHVAFDSPNAKYVKHETMDTYNEEYSSQNENYDY